MKVQWSRIRRVLWANLLCQFPQQWRFGSTIIILGLTRTFKPQYFSLSINAIHCLILILHIKTGFYDGQIHTVERNLPHIISDFFLCLYLFPNISTILNCPVGKWKYWKTHPIIYILNLGMLNNYYARRIDKELQATIVFLKLISNHICSCYVFNMQTMVFINFPLLLNEFPDFVK